MKARSRIIFACCLLAIVAAGCRSQTSRPAPLTEDLQETRSALARADQEIRSLRSTNYQLSQELEQSRRELAGARPDQPEVFEYRVRKVDFGFLTAHVQWEDGSAGIQASVFFEDQFGKSLRRAAAFRLELYDLGQGDQTGRLIQTWTFTPEEAADQWQSLTGSYLFKLPYEAGIPSADKVLLKVVADLTTGGSFEATRVISIRH